MSRAIILVPPLALFVGCGRIGETPFAIDMSVSVPAAEDIPEIPEGYEQELDEAITTSIVTDPISLAEGREQLPAFARSAIAIEAEKVTIGSPELGPVGQWISRLTMRASRDGELSENDPIIGDSTLTVNDDSLVFDIPPRVNELLSGESITVLIDVELREAPSTGLNIPVTLDAVGFLKFY